MSETKQQTKPPARSTARRIFLYLAEMFPPWINGPMALASFYSFYFLCQCQWTAAGPIIVTGSSSLGALTILFILLFLRVCDELKDFEADKELFPDRAVAKGEVLKSDLWLLFGLCLVLLPLFNFALGLDVLPVFIAVYLYALAMYKWFFLKDLISKNLILAVLTHNPIVPLLSYYIFCIAERDGVLVFSSSDWQLLVPLILGFWGPSLAWEVSRKIRAAEQETEYVTYSKILGARPAAALVLLLLTGSLACFAWVLAVDIEQGWTYSPWIFGVLVLAYTLVLGTYGLFLVDPSSARQKGLRGSAEIYMLAVYLGFTVGLPVSRGLSFEVGF
ncbi:MAG: UbiA family prenyltransferase [Planctomycetota bacterium]|nr:UbiA family prenyltransferase [Planctomycetota bacterium]